MHASCARTRSCIRIFLSKEDRGTGPSLMCYALSSVADVDLFRQVGVSAITDGPASCAACAGCAWSAGIEDEAAEWSDWTDSVEHAAYMHSASGGGGGGGGPIAQRRLLLARDRGERLPHGCELTVPWCHCSVGKVDRTLRPRPMPPNICDARNMRGNAPQEPLSHRRVPALKWPALKWAARCLGGRDAQSNSRWGSVVQ